MDFPRTVDEMASEWLTKVFRESGAIADTKVVSITYSNIGDDHGITADVQRFTLTYERIDENAPPTTIAKFGRLKRR